MARCAVHRALLRLRVSLLLVAAVLLSSASGQSTSPLGDPSNGFLWFQLNATSFNFFSVNTTNSTYPLYSWSDSQQLLTLSAVPNTTLPLFDPVGLALTFNSSALAASAPLSPSSSSNNLTVIATFNLAAPCTFPACVLLSTAPRNVTGALLLSAVQAPPLSGSPLPSTNQFYLQLTLVTSPLNAVTVQSAVALSLSQWQYVTLTIPPTLTPSAAIELRTVVGDELLTFVLPPNSTDPMPSTVLLSSFTVGDAGGLHALFRDIAVGFQPLAAGELDTILADFYSLYSLTYPPMRAFAPTVQLINVTASAAVVQLSWSAPFSPTSAVMSYQLRVSSNGSVPLTPAQSLILTFNNLTTYQYPYVRRDGLAAYSFAVTACNADYPYPPVIAPLLYSAPYTAPSGNVSVNSSIPLLALPPVPNVPQVYLASAPNITVNIGWPANYNFNCTLASSPCYPLSPLTSIALFYTNDQSGSSQNFTWVTQPVWSFTASSWSWYALTTGLQGNQFYGFKVQVSNAAGGVNTSVSSGFLLPGSGNAPSSTAGSSTTVVAPTNSSGSTGSAGQGVRPSSSSSGAGAGGTGTRASSVSSSITTSTAASSTSFYSPSSSLLPSGPNASSTGSAASSTAAAVEASSSSSPAAAVLFQSSSSSVANASVSASSGDFGGSNDSLIAGVIIGAFGGVVLLGLLTYVCFCRKRRPAKKTPPHSAAGSTYASPRPSASLHATAAAYEKGVMSPGGAASNRRVQAKRGRVGGGRGGAALSAEGDLEMAELEAEWEGDDAGHQMRPQQEPTHQTVYAFRRPT